MLKNIKPDKWRHFYAGILMGAVLQVAARLVFPAHFLGATLAVFAIVIGVSYGFELVSLITGKGHYDVIDAVASIIGGVVGMLAGAMVWVLA